MESSSAKPAGPEHRAPALVSTSRHLQPAPTQRQNRPTACLTAEAEHTAKMCKKNISRRLPACSLTKLAFVGPAQVLSEQEGGQSPKQAGKQKPVPAKKPQHYAQEGWGTMTAQKSLCYQGTRPRLLTLGHLLPPPPQGTSTNGWAQNKTLGSLFLACRRLLEVYF